MYQIMSFPKINLSLNLLSADDLYSFDEQQLASAVVALKKSLILELPWQLINSNSPPPIDLIRSIAQACSDARNKMIDLGVLDESPMNETLATAVNHMESILTRAYGINQSNIDRALFKDKIYDLLVLAGRYPSDPMFPEGIFDNVEDKKQEEERQKRALHFLAEQPWEVVRTVFDWASSNTVHDARLSPENKQLIDAFNLLKSTAVSKRG